VSRRKKDRDAETTTTTVQGKAFGIIGLRDTVNEARLRSLIPDGLEVVKVELKPDNEGAILEFLRESVRPPRIIILTS
jgi:Occluded RNA-recognition motif